MTPPADPENQPLAERDLEIARAIYSAAYQDDPENGENWKILDLPAMLAKARELCGYDDGYYNAGAAAMREAASKIIETSIKGHQARAAVFERMKNDEAVREIDADIGRLRVLRAAIRALPIPPNPADALWAENARLREALEFYANPIIYQPHPHGPAFDRRSRLYLTARAALGAS